MTAMLSSMTGYGEAELRVEGSGRDPSYTVRAEVRAVNNRFLSIKTRLPEGCQGLMSPVENALRERLSRGSVHVVVALRADANDPRSLIDTELLDAYSRALEKIQRDRGHDPVTLDTLLGLPEVVRANGVVPPPIKELRGKAIETLSQACEQLLEMRRTEGQHLKAAIEEALDEVEQHLTAVRARAGSVVDDYRRRLRARLEAILEEEGLTLDDGDIAREVALFVDRGDITEELSRMDSHVSQLRECLQAGGPIGKKMEFITQEMFREANTILAKVNDPALSEEALSIKTGVEKIKEQALNVE